MLFVGGGLLNCLQDANTDVHELAISTLLVIQEKQLSIDGASSAHLTDLLITSLFCAKRSETVESAMRSARFLLSAHLSLCLPVLLKGTASRNLSSGYQCLVCIYKSLGVEIRGDGAAACPPLSPDLMSSLVDQLLRVIATAKVSNMDVAFCYQNDVIYVWCQPKLRSAGVKGLQRAFHLWPAAVRPLIEGADDDFKGEAVSGLSYICCCFC